LWTRRGPRALPVVTASIIAVAAFAAAFDCWLVAVPTLAVGASMLAARGGERGGRIRRALARITLPEWIMTWFVIVASVLTIIGTFFRGPGWSFVWPWSSFRTW
jgi:hypothetical protein